MSEGEPSDRRAGKRIPVKAEIEFIVDADIIDAESIDVSDVGIGFTTTEPLSVQLRLKLDGKKQQRFAKLVWAQRSPQGGCRYGFEYCTEG